MRSFGRVVFVAIIVIAILVSHVAPAVAQGGTTSSISGTVVDRDGGIIPGASVTAKSQTTGSELTTITNGAGVFSIPSVDAGVYTVTVSLTGFTTYVLNDLTVRLGAPADIKAVLQVGALTEQVHVTGGAGELINTQTPTVSATLMGDQINKMPMASRNLVNAVTFLPGVATAGINRDSSFNGLPDSFVAISLDGINNNENLNKSSEGLFATISPRQDAMEAVTVTTAAAGADVGGHGAVQINFVTRSGTNRFQGSLYEYHREAALNTNYWFNQNAGLPKNEVTLNQYGFRQGGPIVIPGLYDGRGKAFFFFNYEELRFPSNATRNRTILNPLTQDGWMQYNVTSGSATTTQRVNMLALAAQQGFDVRVDQTVTRILGAIRSSTTTTGLVTQQTDPNLMTYTWQSPGEARDKQPIVRVDYNLSAKHRLSGTYNFQLVVRDPDLQNGGDVRFPGGTNLQIYQAHRPLFSTTLRSTLTSSLVNELRVGGRWSPSYFGLPATSGAQTFQDTNGYSLTLGGTGVSLTGWTTTNTPSFRNAWNAQIDDTLTWQRGTHSISAGGEAYFGNISLMNRQTVPSINFGIAANDDVSRFFTTGNFPGASSAQLDVAKLIFATLTGRVTSVSAQLVLDENTNQYQLLVPRWQRGALNEYSAFVQDSWRLTPTLTLNGGLRYQVQTAWSPKNDILSRASYADACGISGIGADGVCRFFQPGASGGTVPQFVQMTKGSTGYDTDWNNVAPNVGAAWRPNVQRGWLRAVLGDPDQATIRGGFSVQYDRQGMAPFTDVFGGNPGTLLTVTRSEANGLLVPTGQRWPVYFSETSRLGLGEPCAAGVVTAACNPGAPTFPIAVRTGRADSLNVFDPEIQIASARSYTVGFQRSLTKEMALEVRYVGTRGINQWGTEAYNARNILENGFLDEFKLAMGNLQASVAAGCGGSSQPACTFAYRGPGTGTSPLPIYLAYLVGSTDAGNPAAYSGTNWTNSTFLGRLAKQNPNPNGLPGVTGSAAQDLDGDAGRRANALRAGLPANFFVLNPDVNNVTTTVSRGSSRYDALQLELRRRLSHGLQVNGSYTYALESDSTFLGQRYGYAIDPSATVRHAIKAQWNYELPFGRDRRFGAGLNPALDAVIGGWSLNGVGRVQARMLNFGSVRLVGLTADDLQQEYRVRIVPDPANPGRELVQMLPDDIILNTRRAFNVSATSSTGYSDALGVPTGRYIAPAQSDSCITIKDGDCAPRSLLIRGPFFTRFDISVSKRVPLRGRINAELSLNVLNVFDNVNFTPVANPGTGATIFQVTAAYQDLSNTYDPGGRLGELVFRLNW
jgi:hypothetical protein